MPALYAFDPGKSKKIKVGEIVGNAVVLKKDSKKHLMRVMDGYGIQASALTAMQENNIEEVRIHETDTGIRWKISVADWRMFGRLADYGNGKQWFVSRKFMRQYKVDTETIR